LIVILAWVFVVLFRYEKDEWNFIPVEDQERERGREGKGAAMVS
jgi:hypothetical protein